jgi:hypothetical protein
MTRLSYNLHRVLAESSSLSFSFPQPTTTWTSGSLAEARREFLYLPWD